MKKDLSEGKIAALQSYLNDYASSFPYLCLSCNMPIGESHKDFHGAQGHLVYSKKEAQEELK